MDVWIKASRPIPGVLIWFPDPSSSPTATSGFWGILLADNS